MLLLAPCQSAMRSGWPASAARTAAVTGATWVGSATSSSIWLTASRQGEEFLRRLERDEDLAAVVFRHADLEHRHHAEAALLRRHAEIGAAACGRTSVSRSPSRSPMRPASRVPTTTVSSPPNSSRLPRRMPPGDDAAGAQFLGRDAAHQAAAGAAGLAGQQHLALDGRGGLLDARQAAQPCRQRLRSPAGRGPSPAAP